MLESASASSHFRLRNRSELLGTAPLKKGFTHLDAFCFKISRVCWGKIHDTSICWVQTHKVRNRVVFLLLCVRWLRLTRTAVQFSLTKSLTLSFARTEDSDLHVLQTTCKVASIGSARVTKTRPHWPVHSGSVASSKLGYNLTFP